METILPLRAMAAFTSATPSSAARTLPLCTRAARPYGRSVQIEGAELEQKLGAVAPGDDFDLALDAVGIHDLPGLQKLIFHLKYLPQAARPGGRALH